MPGLLESQVHVAASWRVVVLLAGLGAVLPSVTCRAAETGTDIPSAARLESEGALIGEVRIYPENIFDLENPREDKALYRLADKLHIRTQPQVIRQQLLFKGGDAYSKRLMEESERILRSTRSSV